jgi:hypothetical protein
MNNPYNSKIIKIDSSKASIYFNDFKTSFMFNLSTQITVASEDVLVYSLQNVWIPNSFYSVSKYNQYLDVRETINNTTTTRTIIIPAGNYDATTFGKTILSLLNIGVIQYTITYNRINNRFTISTVGDASTTFLFLTGTNANISCYKFLGFTQVDTPITNVGVISSTMVLMNDIAYLQIKSDMVSPDSILVGDLTESLLEVIPVSSEPLSFISYAPYQPNKFLLNSNSLSSIKISLIDNYNRDVNLNGVPFLITLKIDVLHSDDVGYGKPTTRANGDEQQLTNLEIFEQNPRYLMKTTPINNGQGLNINDLIEYQLISRELKKINKRKK